MTRWGPGWDAGGPTSALRDSSTTSADAVTAPLASSLQPSPPQGGSGKGPGEAASWHTPGAALPVPSTALALAEVQCE